MTSSTLDESQSQSQSVLPGMVMVVRQPVFDRERVVQAYDLLYRSTEQARLKAQADGAATVHLMLESLLDVGLEQLAEHRTAFIEADRQMLFAQQLRHLPTDRVVLALRAAQDFDDELVEAVRALAQQGYRFAIDDCPDDPLWPELLELAHVVRLDLAQLTPKQLVARLGALREADIRLLVEHVGSDAEFASLREAGCDYFQGRFFVRPNVVRGAGLPNNKLASLRLLSLVQDAETSIQQVAELVTQDPSLSYRLIRFVNSAAVGLPTRATSVHRAVAYLGMEAIRRWVSLAAVATVHDKHPELIRMTLIRARLMELLCERTPRCDSAIGFTLGLFSTLDALMDKPMSEILTHLRLPDELNQALLQYEGPHGRVLRAVVAYENGDWDEAGREASAVSEAQLGHDYADAVQWTQRAVFAQI